jgi:hypothetical protein
VRATTAYRATRERVAVVLSVLQETLSGVRVVQAALRSSTGQTRLSFARHLGANRRGVIESLTALRFNSRTGGMVVDDLRDHPNDALRYLTCAVLGRTVAAPEVLRR